jgi:hypothetical protein
MFTVDQETNPLPLTAIVTGRRAELTAVGDTELSRGSGVSPVHCILLPQVVNDEAEIRMEKTNMRRTIRDIPYLPPMQHTS